MNKLLRIAAFLSVLVAGGLLMTGTVAAHGDEKHASDKGGRVPLPVHRITQGEQCVEPTGEMRRNHMEKILHQRDKTMHQGIRTTQHSLRNCVNCHADPRTNSVLGKDGFCESCHRYAAVTIDCFSCHTPEREASKTGELNAGSPAHTLKAAANGGPTP